MRVDLKVGIGLLAMATGPALADGPPPKTPDAVVPKPAYADAPRAEGFPDATRPGQVEVKNYPAYRGAVVKGEKMTISSGDSLFFPLFNHIQQRDVAMTSPVINTYLSPRMIEAPGALGEVTMEFVYRTPKQGEAGPGVGSVEVVDHPAARFACLGIQGGMTDVAMREGLLKLRSWLAEHKREWVEAGPPRRLGYHGPMTPTAQRLWEIQIPVDPAPSSK